MLGSPIRLIKKHKSTCAKPFISSPTADEISNCLSVRQDNNQTRAQHTHTLNGRSTTKRRSDRSARCKDGNEALDRSPGAHAGGSEAAHEVDGVEDVDVPVLEVAAHPSLHARVVADSDAGVGVEALAWQLGVDLASEADVEDGGEGVGEVEDEDGADEADDAVEVRHGGRDDESQRPVERAEAVPHVAPFLAGDLWEVEDLLKDLDVDCLHSNVEVEHCDNGLVSHFTGRRVGELTACDCAGDQA